MSNHAVPASDREWEAKNDARALMEANRIQSDPKRLKRAQAALTTIEKEAEKTKMEVKVAKGLKSLRKTLAS